MKKTLLLLIISSLLLALLGACINPFMEEILGRGKDNGQQETDTIPPEQLPASQRWSKWVADDSSATLEYSVGDDEVCTITVGGDPEPNIEGNYSRYKADARYSYTAEANTYYIYEFDAWTESGTRNLNIQYYNNWEDDGTTLSEYDFSINSSRQTYRIFGNQIPKDGIRQVEFQCADKLGTFYVKMISITEYDPEQLPASQRWSTWVTNESTELNYSVDDDGVCEIIVSGNTDAKWKAAAAYSYNAEASTSYVYEFKAWTKTGDGNRTLSFQYYWDDDSEESKQTEINLTDTPTLYTIIGEQIPKGGIRSLNFQCADQLGTFYVKVISITKYTSDFFGENVPIGNIFHVANAAEWAAAVSTINGNGAGPYAIIVINSFSMSGVTTTNTFTSPNISVYIIGNHTISLTLQGSLLRIGSGQTVTMKDLKLAGNTGNNASLVYINSGTFNMSGNASVSGNTSTASGGGVRLEEGTFNMSGSSSVSGNTYTNGNGGGVMVANLDCLFTMTDNASVSGNKATNGNGGGVYVYNGTFTMSGGEITNNQVPPPGPSPGSGSGVYLDNGTFLMNNGNITGNTGNNGSVSLSNNSSFEMTSGNISDNQFGVYVLSGKFIMHSGTIDNNDKYGVRAPYANSRFTMHDGEIKNNRDTGVIIGSSGGGVFEMTGGAIFGNTVSSGGAGVQIYSDTTFTVGGTAKIYGNALTNTTLSNVYLSDGTYITLGNGTNGASTPTNDMNIGVSIDTGHDGVIVQSGASAAIAEYFHADDANRVVVLQGGQLVLVIPLSMVYVPGGGSFLMGKNVGNGGGFDSSTMYTATLTSGFYMGKYEVTQWQWQAVMGSLPADLNTGADYGRGDNYPVYYVNWYDAIEFCNALSVKEEFTPYYTIDKTNSDPDNTNANDPYKWLVTLNPSADGYRLPTGAQWEYAAKGGNQSAPGWVGYTLAGSDNHDDVAWYDDNSGSRAHEVGTKDPNGLGLYDMSGNVWEWCWDWYGNYSADAKTDPLGPLSGTNREIRGGSFNGTYGYCRSTVRQPDNPSNPSYKYVGFRVVRPGP